MEVSDEMAMAVDNCGDVVVTVSEETAMGDWKSFVVTHLHRGGSCGNSAWPNRR